MDEALVFLTSLFRTHCHILMGLSSQRSVATPSTDNFCLGPGPSTSTWSRAWVRVLLADPFRFAAPRGHPLTLAYLGPFPSFLRHASTKTRRTGFRRAGSHLRSARRRLFKRIKGATRAAEPAMNFLSVPTKKWFRGGGSYHSVDVMKLNNWRLQALGIHH